MEKDKGEGKMRERKRESKKGRKCYNVQKSGKEQSFGLNRWVHLFYAYHFNKGSWQPGSLSEVCPM